MEKEEVRNKRKEILGEMITILNKEYQRTIPKCGTGIFKHYWRMSEDCLKKYEELTTYYNNSEKLANLKEKLQNLKNSELKLINLKEAKKICYQLCQEN